MSDFLVSFIIWCLGVYGTANIIVFSTIFKPIREFLNKRIPPIGKLVTCILCMGFWSGLFWGWIIWSPSEILYLRNWAYYSVNVFDLVFNGAIGSAVCWLIYLFTASKMVGK